MAEQKLKLTKDTPALAGSTLTRQIAIIVSAIKDHRDRIKLLGNELKELIAVFRQHGGK